MADYFFDEDEDSNGDVQFKDGIYNYRGYFVENEEEEEKKFYEYGAHFPYKYLYNRLDIILKERKENQKALEKKLKEKQLEMNKDSRDDPATNEESKQNDNLKDLLSIFKQKGKSRNRGDVDIGLTYIPQMNKKKEEQINIIENGAINLIKSTAGKKNEIRNNNKNIINGKGPEEKNGANLKYNNYMNKNEKSNNNKNISKKVKSGNQKTKIRKRNENKILNINNSLNVNNTVSLNALNKTKFGDKNNSKNLTHDIPYKTQIKNNLVNKLKYIQYSKEKLRKEILKAGNLEQKLIKKVKMNQIINKFRNTNNKGCSYSNYHGYQSTKNTSSSKIALKNNNNNKNINMGIYKKPISSAHQNNENLDKAKNNNNKFVNQKNLIKNGNTSQNLYIINGNISLNKNIISSKNISINKNANQPNKIQNKNICNHKAILLKKENCKSSAENRNKLEFFENIGNKKTKNNVSRNNNIPIFNNQNYNSINKNFHSVNNPNKKKVEIKNHVNINLTNNFSNFNQQLKTQNLNKVKGKINKMNKNSTDNLNLKKYSPLKDAQKKNKEMANNDKKIDIKKKMNINNIQERLKNHLLKNNPNMNKKNKIINKSLYKNNAFINSDSKYFKKNIVSRNRNENSNINNEKFTGKKNNTMMQNKKKNHININKNINNQQNIIMNKLGNALDNNSINFCSVRDNKEFINKVNKKMEKNTKKIDNYFD